MQIQTKPYKKLLKVSQMTMMMMKSFFPNFFELQTFRMFPEAGKYSMSGPDPKQTLNLSNPTLGSLLAPKAETHLPLELFDKGIKDNEEKEAEGTKFSAEDVERDLFKLLNKQKQKEKV